MFLNLPFAVSLSVIYIYIYIVKLLYELRSRVVCYPKIKLTPRVQGFVMFCVVPSMMLPS